MKKAWDGEDRKLAPPFNVKGRTSCMLCAHDISQGDDFRLTPDGRIAHVTCVDRLPD